MKRVSTTACKSRRWGSDQSSKGAIGVNVPCEVRSTPLASGARSAVTRPAGSIDKTRDSLQISDREELNDERGKSPCQ
jgi:hypothetical protein